MRVSESPLIVALATPAVAARQRGGARGRPPRGSRWGVSCSRSRFRFRPGAVGRGLGSSSTSSSTTRRRRRGRGGPPSDLAVEMLTVHAAGARNDPGGPRGGRACRRSSPPPRGPGSCPRRAGCGWGPGRARRRGRLRLARWRMRPGDGLVGRPARSLGCGRRWGRAALRAVNPARRSASDRRAGRTRRPPAALRPAHVLVVGARGPPIRSARGFERIAVEIGAGAR